jgi:hypothetical protein
MMKFPMATVAVEKLTLLPIFLIVSTETDPALVWSGIDLFIL